MNKNDFYSAAGTMKSRVIGAEIKKLIPEDIRVAAEAVKIIKRPRTPSLVFGSPSKVELLAVLFALQRGKEETGE